MPFFMVNGKHGLARRWIQKTKAHHHHVPEIFLEALLQHGVRRVGHETFGDTDETNLALLLEPAHDRHQTFFAERIILRLNTVQMINVDVIGADQLETLLKTFLYLAFGIGMILGRQSFLG